MDNQDSAPLLLPRDKELARLRRRVDALEALLSEQPRVFQTTITAPAAAGEPFPVRHNLGVVPNEITWIADSAASALYATEADRKSWGDRYIVLRCEKASAVGRLTVRANA